MAGFNLFKVYDQQKNNLVALLRTHQYELVDTKQIQDAGVQFTCDLYFTSDPQLHDVKWTKELSRFFGIEKKQTKTYSAAIIISFNSKIYAAAFGSAHFYISRYSDFQFGIDIASRIISSYRIKNSREFGGVTTKSIEMYNSTDDLSFEAGEAVNYIKGIPEDIKKWGKNISCGQSVQLKKAEFKAKTVYKLCSDLEQALNLPIKIQIPRSVKVKDAQKCKELSAQLARDMENGNYMISISDQQLSGVAFLFSDQCDFVCTSNGVRFEVDEKTDLNTLQEIVTQHFGGNYLALLEAPVEVREGENRIYSKKFICFIDYVDTENHYYLEEGEWYQFDNNYLSNVRNEVDRIAIDSHSEIEQFDETEYQTWLTRQPTTEKHYRERYLNNYLERNHGYTNHDRNYDIFEGCTIELTDLFRNNTIYIVKIGEPQILNYAIDQATASIRVLQRRNFKIVINNSDHDVKKVCLWFFIKRTTKIDRISKVNSLIFLMKLANWRKTVLMSGLQPELRISYKSA